MDAKFDFKNDELIENIWQQQLASYDQGILIPAETFLNENSHLWDYPGAVVDIALNEFELVSRDHSKHDCQQNLLNRFPQVRERLEKQFRLWNAFETVEVQNAKTIAFLDDGSISTSADSPRFLNCKTIGQGATAVVETAFDQELQQPVALKKLHGFLRGSNRATQRLKREAQAVSRLHHPNIVPVFEIVDDGKEIALVSRLVEGIDLRAIAKREPGYRLEQAVEWIRQIAEALHYAHENGVIHRDVKPSNVLIDNRGKAMLIDFGLASTSQSSSEITSTGDLIGTPAFMSPELAQGNLKTLDGRTDVYSTGATFYYLLTGRPPFEGSVSEVIKKVIDEQPTDLQSRLISKHHPLVNVVTKCLQKSPDDRYNSARELADDLRRFQKGEVVLAQRSTPWERGIKYVIRRPMRFVSIAIIALLTTFLLGLLIQNGQVRSQRNRAQQAEIANRKLSATASVDAGRLAMQQGKLAAAIKHFRKGLEQNANNPLDVHFLLVECLFSAGSINEAVEELMQARQVSMSDDKQALFEYWEVELGAIGHPEFKGTTFDGERSELELSKRHFLEGLEAQTSVEALTCFRNSILANPYHHSARKMYLLMALSLAHFEEVQNECRLACHLYPNDVDFRLLSAIAATALNDLPRAMWILEPLSIDEQEKKGWIEFLEYLAKVAKPIDRQGFFESDRLAWFDIVLDTFIKNHLELFKNRRWRFPVHIGHRFSVVTELKKVGKTIQESREEFRELVKAHPEGTLLTIAGENELVAVEPDNLEAILTAQMYFEQAVNSPAWLATASDNSWFGIYGTAMILYVTHKHKKPHNKELMLRAVDKIDPAWMTIRGNVTGMVIPLFNMRELERVKPLIDRWIELSNSDKDLEQAYWHLAVWHRHKENWIRVVQICEQVDSFLPDSHVRCFNWNGLANRAQKEIMEIAK